MKITAKQLSKSYDGKEYAFKPTDFSIEQGEFVTLLGPSGCGKTTLLRLLAGLEIPNGGELYFDERRIFHGEQGLMVPTEKRNIGMVFQDFALWPHMTVFENVAFGLRAKKIKTDIKKKVTWALKKVDLQGYEDRYPKQLSGGQQQRVAFARSIVTEPKLILLDEPLSALDALLRNQLKIELVSIAKELGVTCVYVTHDQEEAMSMSDRIFVMKDGDILQVGKPEDLYHKPADAFVANFVGKSNYLLDEAAHTERAFRPESLSLVRKSPTDYAFKGRVQHVSYLGDRYECVVKHKDRLWILYHSKRLTSGEEITMYLSPGDINVINYQAS